MLGWDVLLTAGLIVWVGALFLRHVAAVACRLQEECEAHLAEQRLKAQEAELNDSGDSEVFSPDQAPRGGFESPAAAGRAEDGIPVVGGSASAAGARR